MDLATHDRSIIWLCENLLGKQGHIDFVIDMTDPEKHVTLDRKDTPINFDDIRKFVREALYYDGMDLIPGFGSYDDDDSGTVYYIDNC